METTIDITVDAWDYFEAKSVENHFENILAVACRRHVPGCTRACVAWRTAELWFGDLPNRIYRYEVIGHSAANPNFWHHNVPGKGIGHAPYTLRLTFVREYVKHIEFEETCLNKILTDRRIANEKTRCSRRPRR